MKKKRIVIASVLKPVDDTRMFEKIGMTLAETGDYEVFIAGFPSQANFAHENIHFLPSKQFKRLSAWRMIAPLRIARHIQRIKPDMLVVTTHELLLVAVLTKIIFSTRIVYDIQENYYRNILYTNAFPAGIRNILALWVRLKEKMLAPFFDQFFLAEKGYQGELTFIGQNHAVLENKCKLPMGFTMKPDKQKIELLFSGTLDESTGVFEAVNVATALHAGNASIALHIIGYCALPSTLSRLRAAINGKSFIRLTGGEERVPHALIMDAIGTAHFGLISYPHSPHTINSVPTKLYEYLSCGLPMIMVEDAPWVSLLQQHDAGIVLDPAKFNPFEVLHQMKTGKFYKNPANGVNWEGEGKKLLACIGTLFRAG